MEPESPTSRVQDAATPFPLVWDSFERAYAAPGQMDELWNQGWRHFGRQFFRHSLHLGEARFNWVQPIRVDLTQFIPARSQRRILHRNADLEVVIGPARLDAERHALFARHRTRFTENVPDSLTDFLGPDLRRYPCELVEVSARLAGQLVAASYLDLGVTCGSGVYAIFDPAHSRRSLGVATLLWEMEFARSRGCRHYHPGYAFHEPSEMDYKKQFAGSEWFDWQGHWRPLPRLSAHRPRPGKS